MPTRPDRRALSRAVLTIAMLAGASAATAQSIDVTGGGGIGAETRSVTVGLRGLDLDRAQDRDRLDRRVRFAVRQVCGSPPRKRLDARNDHAACSTTAIAGAERQLQALVPTMVAGGD